MNWSDEYSEEYDIHYLLAELLDSSANLKVSL